MQRRLFHIANQSGMYSQLSLNMRIARQIVINGNDRNSIFACEIGQSRGTSCWGSGGAIHTGAIVGRPGPEMNRVVLGRGRDLAGIDNRKSLAADV